MRVRSGEGQVAVLLDQLACRIRSWMTQLLTNLHFNNFAGVQKEEDIQA